MNTKNILLSHSHRKYLGHVFFISILLPSTSAIADNTVGCNVGSGTDSTECGIFTIAFGQFATATGSYSEATDQYATAIGYTSDASGDRSTATGALSHASGASTATGAFSHASGPNSTATGYASRASGNHSLANGVQAAAHSFGSVSIGTRAGWNSDTKVTDSDKGIAIGFYSNIRPTSPGAIAIGGRVNGNVNHGGRGAEAAAPGAIALGADVYNDVPNSMLINVPLRIEGTSPPSNALYLTPNSIAMGISSPSKAVHIVKNDGSGAMRIEENSSTVQKRYQIQLENNGPTGFKLSNNFNGSIWQFSQTNSGGFGFANTANGGQDFVMNSDGRVLMGPGSVTNFNLAPDGDLEIPNGAVTATTFHSSSSRATKKDFTKVDTDKLMANIKAMEVTEWRYKDKNTKGRHIGPMAEDFYAMFGLGPDDKHVAATDMASIALIAAKELQKKSDTVDAKTSELGVQTTALKAETVTLKAENNSLKERLSSLEKLVTNLASGQGLLPENCNKVVFNK